MVLVRLLFWAEVREGLNVFLVIAGLLGLGHLLTSAVGYGFLVSGPRERGGLGLAIATASVAAFHLILTILLATTQTQTIWGDQYVSVRWSSFVTEGNELGDLIYFLIGVAPRGWSPGGRAVLAVFANLAEVALVVLFLVTLRSAARNARDPRRARAAMQAVIANSVAAGALLLAAILFGLLFLAVRTEKGGMAAVDTSTTWPST